jgi:tRNA (cytosine49-C5)-methyltransferase
MQSTFFPKEFLIKYKRFCGNEWSDFYSAILEKQPKSFWVNSKKATPKEIESFLKKKNIPFKRYPFSKYAYSIDCKKPGDLSIFKEGKISMQAKAAMLPVVVLSPKDKDYVLDACASPGMKTIQLANSAKKVMAVDVNSTRIKSLIHNKDVYGLKNVEVKRTDARNVREEFDKIMLDAPCSSEGLVRKRREALKGWSNKLVIQKSRAQKDLILSCFDMLKPNGEMVYATCSFAKEENEDIITFLLDKRKDAATMPIQIEGIKTRENKWCKNCVRLWPQDNDTQQFFFAKIKKLK